jgi:hypothetical protein
MKNKRDKDKRDIALQTPDKGKKSNSKTPPDRSGSDRGKTMKKGSSSKKEEKDDDVHGGHGIGNFDEGTEGPQGYGKPKK